VNERLALLRAILADPLDDVRRVAFADWLDENSSSDHDAARAEYIRESCKMKDGRRPIQKAESAWLRENWKRLFPNFVSAAGDDLEAKWQGRYLTLHALGMRSRLRAEMFVIIEFSRGFAARVRFKSPFAYRRFRDAITDDDPVTAIGPYDRIRCSQVEPAAVVFVFPVHWGQDVFDRVIGWDLRSPNFKRWYSSNPQDAEKVENAARDSIAIAMTAIAREWNGLAEPNPPEPA
jgi:uncharacterized protein (TIGR02996 family)